MRYEPKQRHPRDGDGKVSLEETLANVGVDKDISLTIAAVPVEVGSTDEWAGTYVAGIVRTRLIVSLDQSSIEYKKTYQQNARGASIRIYKRLKEGYCKQELNR